MMPSVTEQETQAVQGTLSMAWKASSEKEVQRYWKKNQFRLHPFSPQNGHATEPGASEQGSSPNLYRDKNDKKYSISTHDASWYLTTMHRVFTTMPCEPIAFIYRPPLAFWLHEVH